MSNWDFQLKCKTEKEVNEYSKRSGLHKDLCRVLYVDVNDSLPYVKINHPSMDNTDMDPMYPCSWMLNKKSFKTMGGYYTEKYNLYCEKITKTDLSKEELDSDICMLNRNQLFSWLTNNIHRYNLTEEEYFEYIRMGFQSCELGVLQSMSKDDVMGMLSGFYSEFLNSNLLMSKEEIQKLKSLDEEVTIYRGVSIDDELSFNSNDIGVSWSLSKEKGEWFGNRFNKVKKNQFLLETKVESRLILSYFKDMNEEEVIIDSDYIYNDIKVKNLTNGEEFTGKVECD